MTNKDFQTGIEWFLKYKKIEKAVNKALVNKTYLDDVDGPFTNKNIDLLIGFTLIEMLDANDIPYDDYMQETKYGTPSESVKTAERMAKILIKNTLTFEK